MYETKCFIFIGVCIKLHLKPSTTDKILVSTARTLDVEGRYCILTKNAALLFPVFKNIQGNKPR